MQAMDGPVNFGERDRWWGLLTEGFFPPVYCLNYNPPYYQQLFEQYGFQTYYNQHCYSLPVNTHPQEKFYERYHKFLNDPDFTCEHIRKNNLEKFALDFTTVYNKAWASHFGNKQLSGNQAMSIFKKTKPILDEELVWFVYHKKEPIAFWVNIPDINPIIRQLNGNFGLFSKLKFLWLKKKGISRKMIGLVFGIAPEFQGTGIDGYMIISGANVFQKTGKYDDLELQWIGDFNPKMINIAEGLGAERSRVLKTYRFLFDRSKPFKRHPILGH
jgi:hypothetical protein